MVDAGERADVVLEQVLAASGYLNELEESDDPQDETRVENLAELVAVAREFADEPVAGPSADPADETPAAPGLSDFLERVALVADSDQIPDDEAGVVTLMTLHTAKGLEFPVVFLTGLEDGVFPHMRSLGDQSELEEERRLAYVGVTRAQQRLYVSRAVVRSAWGAPSHNPASRFLDEFPVDLVDWRRTEAAQTSWNRPVLPSLPQRNAGAPTRRFGQRGGPGRRRRPRQDPRGAEPRRRATGSCTTRSAWAASSPSTASATRRWRRSTSGRRASSGCCCATPRWRSSRGAGGSGLDAVREQRGVGVDGVTGAGSHLDVQVRAGDVAGGADRADDLARRGPAGRCARRRPSGGSTTARCRPRG